MSNQINPFPVPFPANYDIKKQAITVPGSGTATSTPIYISAAFPTLPSPSTPGAGFPTTAYESFNLGLQFNRDSPALGAREWDPATKDWAKAFTWASYGDVDVRRTQVGSGLMKLHADGVVGGPKEFAVGVWSANRPEWQYANQACSAYSLTLVSLYDTLGPDVVSFCIGHSEVRLVFASPEHIPALLTLAKVDECKTLKVIVSMDNWADLEGGRGVGKEGVLKKWGESVGIKVLDLAELEALGVAHPAAHIPPGRKSIASICYTSGTTGNPKGAVLTHELLASAVIGNLHGGQLGSNAVLFSYLPLSHIYERFCEDVALCAGSAIGYSCGDTLRLLEDMAILQPTFFVSVPRVLNRVYQALKAQTVDAPGFKGWLCRKVFTDKLGALKTQGTFVHPIWDKLVLKKVRAVLGGKVTYIGSGSAPINPDVLDFLKVAFSCEVCEGYGQTENCGTAVKCVEGDHDSAGTVGPPTAGVEVKLVDVPDMNYFSTDKPVPRGELCTRGFMVIPRYYKDEAKTAETIDADGWLHSGDIASVDTIGRFKIIDRIKNLVKLSQGEYVALEKVENVYALCPLIAQIYIHADSLEDHVVAIVVPDPEKFAALASKVTGTQIAMTDVAALTKAGADRKVVLAVAAELAPYAVKARLAGFEKINNDISILLDPFTMENAMLTPTLKSKRAEIAKVYAGRLTALYAAHPKKIAKL